MIAVIDYGAGNLFSVANALNALDIPFCITARPHDLQEAQGMILPGVGAFPKAMDMLEATGLVPVIREEAEKKPLLGICLGMQMLFEKSCEFQEREGLGLIPGTVEYLDAPGLKIPHMGWNALEILRPDPLLEGLQKGDWVYFVHSYAAKTAGEYLSAVCDYGGKVTAFVRRGNVFGAQFHPEKSGRVGLRILENFGRLAREEGDDL